MQKITPHLWFDKEAKEAAGFYTYVLNHYLDDKFGKSQIKTTTTIHGTPSGDANIIAIDLFGQEFTLINAGPYFHFNPSISFMVGCKTKEEVNIIWNELSLGGTPLMELGSYPFSEHYGWIQDKFGLSWQIMLMGTRPIRQKIIPAMMFTGKHYGQAEDAMNFYTSVFRDAPTAKPGQSLILDITHYRMEEIPDLKGSVKFANFMLEGQIFAAMDSAGTHGFSFNEAVSLVVHCQTQDEIDYFWDSLTAIPEAEQCGWLKDKFGLSWQIVPTVMDEMMADPDQEKLARVTEAFLRMKKFNIKKLKAAFDGK
jgi:predicted 3-demethylubiquinone-9 3-methyltransferase (glyoxalase superfamily)